MLLAFILLPLKSNAKDAHYYKRNETNPSICWYQHFVCQHAFWKQSGLPIGSTSSNDFYISIIVNRTYITRGWSSSFTGLMYLRPERRRKNKKQRFHPRRNCSIPRRPSKSKGNFNVFLISWKPSQGQSWSILWLHQRRFQKYRFASQKTSTAKKLNMKPEHLDKDINRDKKRQTLQSPLGYGVKARIFTKFALLSVSFGIYSCG